MARYRLLLMSLALVLLVGQFPTSGAEPPRSARKAKPKRSSEVTAEQEQEAMRFLRQHHAELAELVEHLQATSPADYHKAIRDLWKTRERLMQIERRDGKRYELELEYWIVQSKIQVLVARLSMKSDEALQEELRSLLGQRVDLRLRMLRAEREKQRERLQKIDDQVERYRAGRLEMIEKEFSLLTSSSKRLKQRRAGRGTKKNTADIKQ